MNRAERRRMLLLTGGPKAEAKSRHHADLPPAQPGQHMWVTVAMYRTANPKAEQFHLDMENLMSIEGPCCFVCEQPWSEALASQRCTGEP